MSGIADCFLPVEKERGLDDNEDHLVRRVVSRRN